MTIWYYDERLICTSRHGYVRHIFLINVVVVDLLFWKIWLKLAEHLPYYMSNYSQITRHNKCTSNVKCMLHENLRNLQLFSGFLLTQSEWGGWVGPVTFLANIRWCKGLQTGLINLLSCFYQYLQVAPESLDISSHFWFSRKCKFHKKFNNNVSRLFLTAADIHKYTVCWEFQD